MVREFHFAAVLLAALVSQGCGIKGPLVPPPAPPAAAAAPAPAPADVMPILANPEAKPTAPGAPAPNEKKP